ncbi:hypothetical protein CCR75_001722 [Bremia lactucae]|uniref:Uncharacterized protein n=1 Tax=Bremia lactucae TaxID=4779 RepID=A0A976IBM9_BRELC|nr:hypothetical protein CCR75_001722 [Bremia lactucae]
MPNLVHQLARLQLGPVRERQRLSNRQINAPPININAASMHSQRISIQRSLLASLHCPSHRVLAIRDGPRVVLNRPPGSNVHSRPVFQVSYAHTKGFFVAVDEQGAAGIVHAASGHWQSQWMAHTNAIFDAIWTQNDSHVLTASGDFAIRIWDVENIVSRSSTPVLTLQGHDRSVKCVRQARDQTHVFASGGRDGKVLLWDTRTNGNPIAMLDKVHAEPHLSRDFSQSNRSMPSLKRRRQRGASNIVPSSPSVTCVEFGENGMDLMTAGATNTIVKCWDLRQLRRGNTYAKIPEPIQEFSCSSWEEARHGISSLMLCPGRAGRASQLLVNVLHDSIVVLDLTRTHQARPILRCYGHESSSFYCKSSFSPQGEFIATASADGVVYIWDARLKVMKDEMLAIRRPNFNGEQRLPCVALKGHTSDVNGVAWSSLHDLELASCSDDGTVMCWQTSSERCESSRFKLQASNSTTQRVEYSNWSAFQEQLDGYSYRVQGPKRDSTSQGQNRSRSIDTRFSPKPRKLPDQGLASTQEERLDFRASRQKNRIHFRRRARTIIVRPKRAQRTLVELWGSRTSVYC